MPKIKKISNKKNEEVNKIEKIVEKDEENEVEEILPEDVQEALGIVKPIKAKIKEVDYISELENGLDGFDGDSPKAGLDDELDSDIN